MKFSENIEKVTLPGRKKLVRYFDKDGKFYRDGILGTDEEPEKVTNLYHPVYPEKHSTVFGLKAENLLKKVVFEGKIKILQESPKKIHGYLEKRAILIAQEHKRYISPHIYKVGISKRLMETRNALTEKLKTLH